MIEYLERVYDLVRRNLGPEILQALSDPDIEEVQCNPDMSVHLISASQGELQSSSPLSQKNVETFLRALATLANTEIDHQHPDLATVLPSSFGKCRLQGFLPPLTPAPAFIIRKPPGRIIALAEYVTQRTLSAAGMQTIQRLVSDRTNIIVAGATASGKTTLCNAILAEISKQFPDERIIVLEDTPELHLEHRNQLRLATTQHHTMRHLVRLSLRSTPRRIIVGEVRDEAARDLLDAWVTGHPGGCGTVHGEDPERALERLAALAREATPGVDQRPMVAQSVQALIFIRGHGHRREVSAIMAVKGFRDNRFVLKELPK